MPLANSFLVIHPSPSISHERKSDEIFCHDLASFSFSSAATRAPIVALAAAICAARFAFFSSASRRARSSNISSANFSSSDLTRNSTSWLVSTRASAAGGPDCAESHAMMLTRV